MYTASPPLPNPGFNANPGPPSTDPATTLPLTPPLNPTSNAPIYTTYIHYIPLPLWIHIGERNNAQTFRNVSNESNEPGNPPPMFSRVNL